MSFNTSLINVTKKKDTCASKGVLKLADEKNVYGSDTNNKLYRFLQTYVLDFDAESRISFDPRSIASSILSKSRTQGVNTVKEDISSMIAYCVQGGSDLQCLLEKTMDPRCETVLKRLIITYSLVSKATKLESITLARVCASFPDLTCQYLLDIKTDPLIPFNIMAMLFTQNYPKVMMDCAFAYLIPDRKDEFCSSLKEAHMVYRYTLYHMARSTKPNVDDIRKIISECIRHTRSAIEKRYIGPYLGKYPTQIDFLKAHGLIIENNSKLIATECVLQAATTWKKHIRTADMSTNHISDDSDYWVKNF